MKLSDLRPTPGSKRRPKRVGRGNASGHGTSATRGGKGQTARTGYRIPPGFEGGQTPLWKRTPKRGFKNALRRSYVPINIGQLEERFGDGTEVTAQLLAEQGLIKKSESVKILGDGMLSKKLIVHAHRFSQSAREKILAAGGQAIELEPRPSPASVEAEARASEAPKKSGKAAGPQEKQTEQVSSEVPTKSKKKAAVKKSETEK